MWASVLFLFTASLPFALPLLYINNTQTQHGDEMFTPQFHVIINANDVTPTKAWQSCSWWLEGGGGGCHCLRRLHLYVGGKTWHSLHSYSNTYFSFALSELGYENASSRSEAKLFALAALSRAQPRWRLYRSAFPGHRWTLPRLQEGKNIAIGT